MVKKVCGAHWIVRGLFAHSCMEEPEHKLPHICGCCGKSPQEGDKVSRG